jgi:uncharacterized protein YoxC
MASITESVSMMETGTREIANGTDDLSKRTERQAAALEETAAAVEEITANVVNSTQRTEEARGVASQANSSANQSSEVVGQAEDAMRRIEESSKQISNIIGVIDEIAFQTNLLALNAGVEAARAGEAGKRLRGRRPGSAGTGATLGQCSQGDQGTHPELLYRGFQRRRPGAPGKRSAPHHRWLHYRHEHAHGRDRDIGEGAVDRPVRGQPGRQLDGPDHPAECRDGRGQSNAASSELAVPKPENFAN